MEKSGRVSGARTTRRTACASLLGGAATVASGGLAANGAENASPRDAVRAMLARLIPGNADRFLVEMIPAADGRSVFEIESRNGNVVLRGDNGVSAASALNWYLKYYCHSHISLWGSNLRIPDPLPAVNGKIRRESPFRYRYYLNFCAFSYSVAWWDWPQWERLIDWMALHGINMPLSVTGQEAIWHKVYSGLGLRDRQIREFLVGPGYLPFGWMGCMDGWAGPLSGSWIDSHLELEKKIVARERELGMTPVLQGFTGHVPAALSQVFPDARLLRLPSWAGFTPTHFLDPQDPLFVRVGKLFIDEQTRQFGADHLYASDTFIEMPPPSNDPGFLAAMGRSVYAAMRAADPQAVWVMQGWMFVFNASFWKLPQSRALLTAVPDDRMILLDLACENMPVWKKTEAFHGKPWIWNVIQDYGNVVSLHAGLPQIAGNLREAMTSPQRGKLAGLGMVNEGLGYNPVVNDFLGEMAWRSEVPELSDWIPGHIEGRYGSAPAAARRAWGLLLRTAYNSPVASISPVVRRPALLTDDEAASRVPIRRHRPSYDVALLGQAWRELLSCAGQLEDADTYRFDLVHVARQVLADLAFDFSREIAEAYRKKDRAALGKTSGRFLRLIGDMDELVGTRKEFLLGQWLGDARRWGANEPEKRHNEWNARTIITLWGSRDSKLHEYANKQWSGMLDGFYLPRWKMFFERLDKSLAAGTSFDAEDWERATREWEEQWARRTDTYRAAPRGDSVAIARKLWNRYEPFLTTARQPAPV